jgi:hypothetical protein
MSSTMFKLVILAAAAAFAVGLAGCGVGEDTDETSEQSSASCSAGSYPDTMGYSARLKKYANEPQCSTQVQAAEIYRQNAIKACSAGNMSGAATQYDNYKKSVQVVNSFCP